MGLLKFLASRRGPGDNSPAAKQQQDDNSLTLTGHSYDAAAAALPPTLGNTPVTGNGPKTIQDLRVAAERKQSDASLPTSNTSAPSLRSYRRRSRSASRPNTAPTRASLPPQHRPKSAGLNPPRLNSPRRDSSNLSALPPRKTTPGPPYLLGIVGPDASNNDSDVDKPADQVPPVPRIASLYKDEPPASPRSLSGFSKSWAVGSARKKAPAPLSPSVASSRGGAIPSPMGTPTMKSPAGPARGYVDLLDASGAFKPSDFKTRLQASGARDYGEDVAERNLGVNGVDLESPAVVAFYALTGGGPLAYKSDGSAVDVHGNRYAADNIPTNLATQVQGKSSDELSALANNRIRTPKFPTRTSSLEPPRTTMDDEAVSGSIIGQPSSIHDTANMTVEQRRRSVHGGFLSSSAAQPPRARPLSMHPLTQQSSFDEPADVPDIPRARPTSSPAPDLPLKSPRAKPAGSKPRGRSRVSSSRDKASHVARSSSPEQFPLSSRDASSRPRSIRSIRSAMSQASTSVPTKYRSASLSGEAATSRLRSESRNSSSARRKIQEDLHVLDFDIASIASSDAPPSKSSRRQSRSRSQPRAEPLLTSPTPRSSTLASPHPRKRSIGMWTQLDDISETLPRPSTASQNRPHTRHGADSSLDLGYSLPTSTKGSELYLRGRNSAGTMQGGRRQGGGHSYQTQLEESTGPADGYASSTTSSLGMEYDLEVKRQRQRDDEDLVFREGDYGDNEFGLPGLPGLGGDFGSMFGGGASFLEDEDEDLSPPIWSSTCIQTVPREHRLSSRQQSRSRSRSRASRANRAPTSAPRGFPDMAMMAAALPKSSSVSRGPSPMLFPAFDDYDDDTSSLTMSESDPDHILASGTVGTKSSSAETDSLSVASPGKPSARYDDHTTTADDTDLDFDMDVPGPGASSADTRMALRLCKEVQRREEAAAHRGPIRTKRAMDKHVL